MVSEIKAAMDIGNLQNDRQSELGLVVLEIAIAKFDSLAAEATRLAGEVQKIASTEAELLRDESLSEAAATKRLIEIRAKAGVLRARAKVAGERLDEQTELVLELISRHPANTVCRLIMIRSQRFRGRPPKQDSSLTGAIRVRLAITQRNSKPCVNSPERGSTGLRSSSRSNPECNSTADKLKPAKDNS